MLILSSLLIIALFQRLTKVVTATEEQCHVDCSSSARSPTRPWQAIDTLQNQLHLTRPYPFHIAAENTNVDIDEYSLPEFCKLGCTYFFVSSSDTTNNDDESQSSKTTTLGQCLDKCDDTYSYNSSTPPYNDLAQVARLECRDGCMLALIRCQPGYYCLQVSFSFADKNEHENANDANENADDDDNSPHYQGGEMIPCQAGTYRDVSYDSVIKCIPCPSNYFREDTKGKSLSSCSPCPAGTSAEPGSTSIQDCVRCPAGTFSTEASFCMCITPQACADDPLPPPADAEKRDTVPYIGRW